MTLQDSSSAAQLLRLRELIDEPVVRARMREGHYDQISQALQKIADNGEGSIQEGAVSSLVKLVTVYEPWLAKYSNQPPVFASARSGEVDAVLAAVDAGLPVDAMDADGMTLLMIAAVNGHAVLSARLIELGANMNATCEQESDFDAFMFACSHGQAAVASLLLDSGADVNKRYASHSSNGRINGQTALGIAANRGHVEVCRLLIGRGADMEVVAASGYTALMWALVNGASEDAAELLLDFGANPEPNTRPVEAFAAALTTPLILAASNGFARATRRLIAQGVNLDAQDHSGWTALKHASLRGSDDIVDALVSAGADLDLADNEGWTPLIGAASRASWSTMDRLIAAGANVSHQAESGNTALRQVLSRRLLRHMLVNLSRLTGKGLDPEQQEGYDMAFQFAEKLLEAGADPNVTYEDDSDQNLIDEASEHGDQEICELLERFGAQRSEAQAADDDGSDAFDMSAFQAPSEGDQMIIAASRCDIDRVATLLESGVDVDHLDGDGDTALAVCVYKVCHEDLDPQRVRDCFEIIDLLLSYGASVDVPGCRFAPLPMVARAGSLALTNAFLSAGADTAATLTAVDPDEGKTALEVAREHGHDEVAAALLAAGRS